MQRKLSKTLGLLVAPLLLVGCADEPREEPDAAGQSTTTPSPSVTPIPSEAAAVEEPNMEEACETALTAMPRGMLPAEGRLVAAADELQAVIEAANNVDVTFALEPMVQALQAKATAGQGQPAVQAEGAYLDAVEELDRACESAGVEIIRD